MPDSLRIKEIHQALEAQTYSTYTSTDSGEEKARVANLGYLINRIAKILGINVLADGVTYKPLEPSLVAANDLDPETDQTVIPAPYRFAHWGYAETTLNQEQLKTGVDEDGNDEFEETDAPLEVSYDALVYEFFSNKFIEDANTGEKTAIIPTGYGLVHNLPQLYRQNWDDFDKALGLQESSAFAVRSAEDIQTNSADPFDPEFTPKICTYEGQNGAIAEILYMLSEISRRSSSAQISSLINTACLYELMNIKGLPIEAKYFEAKTGLEESSGLDIKQRIYHPGFSQNAPRDFELFVTLMNNIAPLLGSTLNFDKETQLAIQNMSQEEKEEFIEQFNSRFNG